MAFLDVIVTDTTEHLYIGYLHTYICWHIVLPLHSLLAKDMAECVLTNGLCMSCVDWVVSEEWTAEPGSGWFSASVLRCTLGQSSGVCSHSAPWEHKQRGCNLQRSLKGFTAIQFQSSSQQNGQLNHPSPAHYAVT